MSHLIKAFVFAVGLGLLGWGEVLGSASAQEVTGARERQGAGLMWNRTGLPAVFPLQVRSPAGRDYLLTLVDHETGSTALAAYIEGGAFFRVLVPPGTYRVRFAAGEVWQGEASLFGPGARTEVFELDEPLTFAVRNPAIKAGHLIDLQAVDGRLVHAETTERLLCQSVRWAYLRWPVGHEIGLGEMKPEKMLLLRSQHGQLRFPDRSKLEDTGPQKHFEYRDLLSYPDVRSRPCG